MSKSETDLHWNARALSEPGNATVNISDTVQRDLELDFVFANLPAAERVLEIGCGNGYVTDLLRKRVKHIDAFDLAENMIERARNVYGETNNRFFCGNLLDRATCSPQAYDVIVCIRVLINLRNLDEQIAGLGNLAHWLKPGGKLILIEGFLDGFDALNRLRAECDMPGFSPAAINRYPYLAQLKPTIDRWFDNTAEFHTGMFDFLTRIIYPRVAGIDQLDVKAEFQRRVGPVVGLVNPDALRHLGRERGFALIRRAEPR